MNPAQSRRLKHEGAEETGQPLDVHRNGHKIATLRRHGGRWTGHMTTSDFTAAYDRVLDAELAAVQIAKRAEGC